MSTQEYIPTALVQKTATTTKSLIRSESSGVVERVDLGLPQDADLEGWRDSLPWTLAEAPPRTVRYPDERDSRCTDYDRRSRDRHETRDRDNSKENQKSHRSRSRNRDPERRRSSTPERNQDRHHRAPVQSGRNAVVNNTDLAELVLQLSSQLTSDKKRR